MNKTFRTIALCMGLLLLIQFHSWGQEVSNRALDATPTTSFVSSWESLDAVNDGATPANSNDKSSGAYGNWDNPNSFQWVQYDWPVYQLLSSSRIYWFDDGGGVLVPTDAYIEYLDGDAWVEIDEMPKAKNSWNELDFDEVRTKSIRVTMRNSSQSTGILEWEVYGYTEVDEEAPSVPQQLTLGAITKHTASLSWDVSTDNSEVTGYQVYVNGTLDHTSTTNYTTVNGLQVASSYDLYIKAIDYSGNESGRSDTISFTTLGQDAVFEWGDYPVENVTYEFSQDYPDFEAPTEILDDCSNVAGEMYNDWWVFRWGTERNELITDVAIEKMLESFQHEFGVLRYMGWPPDRRARNGYKSAIYLYGSGLCTDNASPDALGGWQGTVYYDGTPWEMVLASYYPVRAFDPAYTDSDKQYQTEAMIHEGIHSVFSGMPGIKNASWFHEGCNTYLQREALALQDGDYTRAVGNLTAINFIAPFMPIECYSGWLQDGSFGGPSAEGVNQGDGVSSWRNITGGTQYSSAWGIFQHQRLGEKTIPWLWQHSPDRVLEGLASGLGDANMRRLITEYHAKQALVDMGPWSYSILTDMKAIFNVAIDPEGDVIWKETATWMSTPYVATANVDGVLTPEQRTLPGWSGANQIPINVAEGATAVTVDFMPRSENMTLSLVYRAEDGTAVYGEPVTSGKTTLTLDLAPANGVVIAVISNSDYIYEGEATRTAHYSYQVGLGEGTDGTADIYTAWFDYDVEPPVIEPQEFPDFGGEVVKVLGVTETISTYPNPVKQDQQFSIISGYSQKAAALTVFNLNGQEIYQSEIQGKLVLDIDEKYTAGIYFALISHADGHQEKVRFLVSQ